MNIEIANWDFVLGRCNDPIPMITFVPTMDILELARRNNDRLWVTFADTGLEEYDGNSFNGIIDKSMANNPCKSDLSSQTTYYTMTFPEAPYLKEAKGGRFFINLPLKIPPPSVLDPVENFEETSPDLVPGRHSDSMDSISLLLMGGIIAIALGIAIMHSGDN